MILNSTLFNGKDFDIFLDDPVFVCKKGCIPSFVTIGLVISGDGEKLVISNFSFISQKYLTVYADSYFIVKADDLLEFDEEAYAEREEFGA